LSVPSPNEMESANSGRMGVIRRVCNFKDGAMTLRYAATGFLEAERDFRRIKGYRQIPILQSDLAQLTKIDKNKELAYTGICVTGFIRSFLPASRFFKFHDGWDRLKRLEIIEQEL
jgi:hypothetical protein